MMDRPTKEKVEAALRYSKEKGIGFAAITLGKEVRALREDNMALVKNAREWKFDLEKAEARVKELEVEVTKFSEEMKIEISENAKLKADLAEAREELAEAKADLLKGDRVGRSRVNWRASARKHEADLTKALSDLAMVRERMDSLRNCQCEFNPGAGSHSAHCPDSTIDEALSSTAHLGARYKAELLRAEARGVQRVLKISSFHSKVDKENAANIATTLTKEADDLEAEGSK